VNYTETFSITLTELMTVSQNTPQKKYKISPVKT